MTTPVCFIDANDIPVNAPLNFHNKPILGWTLMPDQPTFGQLLQLNGETLFVANWFYTVQAVPELTLSVEIPTPVMEVWLVDQAEMQRRQIAAARAQATGGLVGVLGADADKLLKKGNGRG